MSNELAPVTESCVVERGEDLELTAVNSLQMGVCMDRLTTWAEQKAQSVQLEVDELATEVAIATKNKWRTATLKRHHALAVRRVAYYNRLRDAIRAGYCPIPNLPGVQVFAIRTDKESPYPKHQIVRWVGHADLTQEPAQLPGGEGRYVGPEPTRNSHAQTQTDNKGNKEQVNQVWADEWQDVEFPVSMAKPEMMEVTSRAMALRVFDEFGLLPAGNPNRGRSRMQRGDPLILGRIIDPRSTPDNKKMVTFIIGWRLDTAAM